MENVLNKIEKFNRNFHEQYLDDHPLDTTNIKSQERLAQEESSAAANIL